MPIKEQGNNTQAKAGLGKRTKRAFKRLFGMKVSNNAANTQTKKYSGNQHKTINPFNNPATPKEEKINLFDTYAFVITNAGTNNYTVVINSLKNDGTVEQANISAQDISSPEKIRDTGNTPLLLNTSLTALKRLFPAEENSSELEIVKRVDNSTGYKYNFGSLNLMYKIKKHIP